MQEWEVPSFFDEDRAGEVWRVPYQERAEQAMDWANQYDIGSSANDQLKICLMLIDCQNTFCIPDFELFVGGAVEDNIRLAQFIYRNIGNITHVAPTLDTHTVTQIFHPIFWVDANGEHPTPSTVITKDDVANGIWTVNPAITNSLGNNYTALQRHGQLYTEALDENSKYPLIIWPYHAMLGGIGHALVSTIEEATFFHNLCRTNQTEFKIKGGNPLTENYSIFNPEVRETIGTIAQKNTAFLEKLLNFDIVIIAGQAKSHCVAWTISDLLEEILAQDRSLVDKVYLLEDCTSPVVIPNVIDFTDQANEAFDRFRDAGMHVVRSTENLSDWEGID